MGLANISFCCMVVMWLSSLTSCWVDATTVSTIVVGAGMSGITAAKTLSEKGVKDFIILEATDRIGGRMKKKSVGGYTVEMGANWVEGVGSTENVNPIWTLAKKYNLRTFYSDYSNISYNIYDQDGSLLPQSVVEPVFDTASDSSEFSEKMSAKLSSNGEEDISILSSQRVFGRVPTTPLEMAVDYYYYDFETAEPPRVTSLTNVEPYATFVDFGDDNYFVADSRGYEHVVHKLAEEFLELTDGKITDERLKLNKVVRKIEYSDRGVKISTEDGSIYTANNTIVSVSAGVLQTDLIEFKPDLPEWKVLSINKWDMAVYIKIFMKFPYKFWPSGPGTEWFIYAHERRGYYNIWQHLENEYPGGNLLMVTVTDDEARRVQQQSEEDTKAEIMIILRQLFGNSIPEMNDILIPKWGQDRFYKGTFSNWPIGVSVNDFNRIKAPIGSVFFTGEHTSQKYNGYVHGAYLAGIDTSNMVLDCMLTGNCANNSTFISTDTQIKPIIKPGQGGNRARRKAQISKKLKNTHVKKIWTLKRSPW